MNTMNNTANFNNNNTYTPLSAAPSASLSSAPSASFSATPSASFSATPSASLSSAPSSSIQNSNKLTSSINVLSQRVDELSDVLASEHDAKYASYSPSSDIGMHSPPTLVMPAGMVMAAPAVADAKAEAAPLGVTPPAVAPSHTPTTSVTGFTVAPSHTPTTSVTGFTVAQQNMFKTVFYGVAIADNGGTIPADDIVSLSDTEWIYTLNGTEYVKMVSNNKVGKNIKISDGGELLSDAIKNKNIDPASYEDVIKAAWNAAAPFGKRSDGKWIYAVKVVDQP
jgi:hypothetical protein